MRRLPSFSWIERSRAGCLRGGRLFVLAALVAWLPLAPAAAAGGQATGSGVIRTGGPSATFVVALDDARAPSFAYSDYSSDPPRVLSLTAAPSVDCLGELFGGQTLRLTGAASDSLQSAQPLTLQVYLVDGGAAGIDQLSLKVSQADGSVVYFAPLRRLESGDLAVSCTP